MSWARATGGLAQEARLWISPPAPRSCLLASAMARQRRLGPAAAAAAGMDRGRLAVGQRPVGAAPPELASHSLRSRTPAGAGLPSHPGFGSPPRRMSHRPPAQAIPPTPPRRIPPTPPAPPRRGITHNDVWNCAHCGTGNWSCRDTCRACSWFRPYVPHYSPSAHAPALFPAAARQDTTDYTPPAAQCSPPFALRPSPGSSTRTPDTDPAISPTLEVSPPVPDNPTVPGQCQAMPCPRFAFPPNPPCS